MSSVTVTCSRCSAEVDGILTDEFSGGFYVVSEGTPWHRFARDGEVYLCDPCMWATPEYAEIYPSDSEANTWRLIGGPGQGPE